MLIRGRKTSGILMESSAEGARIAFAVLGIGVNLNVDRETFPDDFRALATSLASELGRPIDRAAFARRSSSPSSGPRRPRARRLRALRPRFERYFRMAGSPVTVEELGGRRTEGVARGIATNGALEIEVQTGERAGEIIRVLAGDVTLAKPAPDGR